MERLPPLLPAAAPANRKRRFASGVARRCDDAKLLSNIQQPKTRSPAENGVAEDTRDVSELDRSCSSKSWLVKRYRRGLSDARFRERSANRHCFFAAR